jgi:hypothetical protein
MLSPPYGGRLWPGSPLVGRCLEEPQHERGDKLRIVGDRDVAQTGEPLHLRVPDEGEEPRALQADQRVGGPLQEKDRRRNPRGECGGAAEAGKVEQDDIVVVAEGLEDRLPADRGLSDPVEQDQWLARSGPMMGEIVEGGRSQAGRDDVSLVGRNGFRAAKSVQLPRGAALFPRRGEEARSAADQLDAARQSGTVAGLGHPVAGDRIPA